MLIVSCGKDRTREQQVSAMIDKIDSPFLIASMNVQNLMDKSEVMEEGTLPFTYYQVISFFLAVELTGIDYDTDAQFVMGKGESFVPSFYGIFKVDKEELFTTLLEVEANAEIKEKDGFKYAIKEKENYCVTWNDEFAIISTIPMDIAAILSGKGDGGEKQVDKNIEIIKAGEEGEINEDYVAFLEKKADIAMTFDGKPFYKYMKSVSLEEDEQLEKMKEIYEGMSYEMYMNFNKGSMDIEMVADLDKKLKDQLDFIGKGGVSDKLFGYGKRKNPMMTGTYKIDVGGMMDYMKDMSEEDYNDMTADMEKAGLAIDDIKDAFSGELVYMIDEITEKEVVYDFGYEEPIIMKETEAYFGLAIGVGDASIIQDKLQEVMLMEGMDDIVADVEDQVDIEMDEFDFEAEMPEINMLPNGVIQMDEAFIYLGTDVLFMTNDSAWANMIAAGNGVTVDNPNGILTEKAVGMYADLTQLKAMGDMNEDQAQMLALFKSFYGSADLDGGKFTLELTDDSENSLKILTMAIGSMLAEFEKALDPDLEAELEEAIEEGEDAFDKLDEELENIDLEEKVEDAKEILEEL